MNDMKTPVNQPMAAINGEAYEILEDFRKEYESDPSDFQGSFDLILPNLLDLLNRAYRLGLKSVEHIYPN